MFCIVAVVPVVITAAAVTAVTTPILLLNVTQSVLVNNPRLDDDASGKLNVCVEPDEIMLKSDPVVPVAKVCVDAVNPLSEIMAFPVNNCSKVIFLTVLSAGFHVKMESDKDPENGYFNLKAGRILLFPLSMTNRAL